LFPECPLGISPLLFALGLETDFRPVCGEEALSLLGNIQSTLGSIQSISGNIQQHHHHQGVSMCPAVTHVMMIFSDIFNVFLLLF
jgi:hypothetical protein